MPSPNDNDSTPLQVLEIIGNSIVGGMERTVVSEIAPIVLLDTKYWG